MAQKTAEASASPSPATPAAAAGLKLKDPITAGLLAWLVPGLGHLYQGRWAKGLLFFICIVGTFAFGQYLGGGRVVFLYSQQFKPERFRWHFLPQVCVGLPALPALIQLRRGSDPGPRGEHLLAPRNWYAPPMSREEMNQLHRVLQRRFDLAAVFTVIAGLLNVLAIYDAVSGPVYLAGPPRSEDDPPQPADAAPSTA